MSEVKTNKISSLASNNDITLEPDGTGVVNLADNDKLTFGAGSDLQIYHTGTKSVVSDQGTGNLQLQGNDLQLVNANDTATYLYAVNGSFTKLYHNNSEKLATTSSGVDVTGQMLSDSLVVDGDGTFRSSSPNLAIQDTDTNRYLNIRCDTRLIDFTHILASGEDMDTVHPEFRFSFTDANETRNLFRIIGDNDIPRMSSAHNFTLADDSTVTIHGASAGSAGSSLFAVYEHGSGYGALVHVNYGTSTVINNSNGTQYVTTDTDGKYGCILTSNHGITFKNRAGATKTYSMSVFGSYMIGQS